MQVHAVPDSERVRDSHGRLLPWGYASYTDSDHATRRIPQESGPFGKARKRGLSRSKTGTPAVSKEDKAKQENQKAIDDIFSSFKADLRTQQESSRARKPSAAPGSLPISASAPNLGLEASAGPGGQLPAPSISKEPTEVILYGFGNEYQWAAIDYFEKISRGTIYEDYDRYPPHSKYNLSLSISRATSQRGLSQSAIRKKNEYVGGEHWIKVTFDSPEAAERACYYQPHNIQGYEVHAERYRGVGPSADVAIPVNKNGKASVTASPQTISSNTIPFGTSTTSETASSATATASIPASMQHRRSEPSNAVIPVSAADASSTALSRSEPGPRASTLRVRGAKTAVLLPPEQAFLPAAPRWQQTFGALPVIGWVVGSGHGIIGDQVPRKEDGSFDEQNASVYWKFWYMIDRCFGTNVCGCWDIPEED